MEEPFLMCICNVNIVNRVVDFSGSGWVHCSKDRDGL